MAETSMPWDGTTVGDATVAPYDAASEFNRLVAAVCGSYQTANLGGVVRNTLYANYQLLVSGVASPLTIEAGIAINHGIWYWNDAPIAQVISTPAAAVRIDRIVLRKDWVAQTVRLTVIAGLEGGAAPALTQTSGVVWDIPIAQVSTTVGGVCTVTDEREFVIIPNLSITLGMLANGIFTADAAGRAKFANQFFTTTMYGLDSVDDTIVGIKVPRIIWRQGGDATDWNLAGLVNRELLGTGVMIQCGNVEDTDFDSAVSVVFPIPFTGKPLVFTQSDDFMAIQQTIAVHTVTVNGFSVIIQTHFVNPADPHELSNVITTFNWLAIGPCAV